MFVRVEEVAPLYSDFFDHIRGYTPSQKNIGGRKKNCTFRLG